MEIWRIAFLSFGDRSLCSRFDELSEKNFVFAKDSTTPFFTIIDFTGRPIRLVYWNTISFFLLPSNEKRIKKKNMRWCLFEWAIIIISHVGHSQTEESSTREKEKLIIARFDAEQRCINFQVEMLCAVIECEKRVTENRITTFARKCVLQMKIKRKLPSGKYGFTLLKGLNGETLK